jgi:hypothetical protein
LAWATGGWFSPVASDVIVIVTLVLAVAPCKSSTSSVNV